MSAEGVQDAIVKQLRNDTDVHSEFNFTLTGTLTFTIASTAITGVGTAFTTELAERNYIRATTSTTWYKIASIESDTALTLESNFLETTETGVIGYKAKVSKGMGRNFKYVKDSMGIYVYHMLENWTAKNLPHKTQEAVYPFLVIALFYDDDEESAETRKTQYSKTVRRALERNLELLGNLPGGETITNMKLQDTRFYFHPQIEGSYYLVVPLAVFKKEPVGDN